MFMVMVISATRTIAIFRPFYEIKRMGVIVVCVVFELFWILLDAIILGTGSLKMVYYAPATVCGMIPVNGAPIWIWNFLVYITMLWLVLGSLVVFVSFILSLRTISARKRFAAQNLNERKFWEVSITITLFTDVFLLYNLPLLVLQTWANVIYLTGTTDYDAQNEAYSWYGLLISHLFLTSFNAASNPTFYFFQDEEIPELAPRKGNPYKVEESFSSRGGFQRSCEPWVSGLGHWYNYKNTGHWTIIWITRVSVTHGQHFDFRARNTADKSVC